MGTRVFRRAARLAPPAVPSGEVHLEAPPEIPRAVPTSPLLRLLPLLMVVGSLGFIVVIGVDNPTSWLFGGMFALSTLGMVAGGVTRGGGQRRAEADEDRKDYLRYLAQMRRRARETAVEQRRALEWTHPDPAALVGLARGPRMWERRPADADFAHVRVGRGSQRLATALVPPQTGPVDDLEPVSTVALRRFVRTHSIVPDLPTAVSLRAFASVAVGGADAATRRGLVRALVAQLVTFHSPDDLVVAVAATGPARAEWEWVKWLPHVAHPRLTDGAGPVRMVTSSLAAIESWLAPELAGRARFARGAAPAADTRHVVVVLEDAEVAGTETLLLEEGLSAVTVVDLSDSLGTLTARRGLGLVLDAGGDGRIGAVGRQGTEWFGRPDVLGAAEAEALARRLAPCRTPVVAGGEDEPLLTSPGILELLGVDGEPDTFDVAAAWRPRPLRDRLRVPFGVSAEGEPVELDIKEAAQEGMGPHGLCVGATGSGKSELLRTLVLGLITTHSSEALNLVLVDFKGGATFAGLAPAPHVAAVITNLADDLSLVDRMQDALAGEMQRRQELLRAAGNLAGVTEYERARENGAPLEPLPTLFVVVDEFSELLSQKPDFAELFVAIGRLGRSLQMHLLLASQRLEEGRLRGLDSHLSYRIGLKTFSASDSRAVLGVPDAAELPPVPGSGYLKVESSSMVRFKAGYVSAPHRSAERVAPDPSPVSRESSPRPFSARWVEPAAPTVLEARAPGPPAVIGPHGPSVPRGAGGGTPSVLDVVVERLRGQGPPAHEVWLPPLADPATLDALLPPLTETPDRGLAAPGFPANGALAVPVGIVDRPYDQRRDVLWAELAGSAGHVVVAGGPQSGKSTLLRTLVAGAALTHTPAEVQFYAVDLGGGTLAGLAGLPHVGAVAGRGEPDLVRRTVAEVAALLAGRERWFREAGVESMADLRARRRRGELAPGTGGSDLLGDVFLVVDGWHAFRSEHEQLEQTVISLATAGLSYGVHVVITASRWAELRPALKDLLGTRFELRLGDPSESEVDRRTAAVVPAGRPGRGLSPDKLHVLTALPRLDGVADAADLGRATAELVTRVAAAWTGPGAPRVRLLPELVGAEALPGADEGPPHLLPLGLSEDRLAPVLLDVAADPHFVCYADAESGKTALLRGLAHQIVTRYRPDQARLVIVDYRRSLLGAVASDHLISYTSSAPALTDAMGELVGSLQRRLPGPDVTPEQLRARSWWTGPDVFVLVDDYDLVAGAATNPLAALLDLLPQARDVGLHLVVARRTGGASRAMYEPVLARLRELSSPGIVMSGSRDEGVLLGSVRPGPQPPGRGWLVGRRHGERLVQVGWRAPDPPITGPVRPAGAAGADP
ncbi:type VII secretion protein EccCa [Actinomycetospora straminea]|uniref:Type VII secretion protein EccC n=1 Tax=Actinomycetospora straminea TaxID=663607 RepID=A0ABP9E242_9PSEU|nr:type VII secretion protein EccCa [Actinomycetospora straminea]MDD7931261.1 type VII secretion protein EccCa [Actinomycetospora straminea]